MSRPYTDALQHGNTTLIALQTGIPTRTLQEWKRFRKLEELPQLQQKSCVAATTNRRSRPLFGNLIERHATATNTMTAMCVLPQNMACVSQAICKPRRMEQKDGTC